MGSIGAADVERGGCHKESSTDLLVDQKGRHPEDERVLTEVLKDYITLRHEAICGSSEERVQAASCVKSFSSFASAARFASRRLLTISTARLRTSSSGSFRSPSRQTASVAVLMFSLSSSSAFWACGLLCRRALSGKVPLKGTLKGQHEGASVWVN